MISRAKTIGAGRRFPFGLTIAAVIGLSILISLGVWQLHRLAWKEDLLARREALRLAPARPLLDVLTATATADELDMHRVEVDCPGLAQAAFQSLYGSPVGQIVTRFISACPLAEAPYGSILVDRGQVPDTISARPPVAAGDTPVHVVGVLMRNPEPTPVERLAMGRAQDRPALWMRRDIKGMAAALQARDPAPVFLVAETSSNPEWAALKPGLPATVINNRHLEYAWTWFGLAGALACVYAAMLWRRRSVP